MKEYINRPSLILLALIVCIYTLAYSAWTILFIGPIQIEHTYLKPLGSPGDLTSRRYNFEWVMLFLGLTKPFFLATVITILAFRDVKVFVWLFSVILVFFFLVNNVYFFFLAKERLTCNGPEQRYNICSDQLYCQAQENLDNPANGCENTLPGEAPVAERPEITGTVTLSDLKPRPEFDWIFWPAFVLWLIDICILGLVAYNLMRDPVLRKILPIENLESRVQFTMGKMRRAVDNYIPKRIKKRTKDFLDQIVDPEKGSTKKTVPVTNEIFIPRPAASTIRKRRTIRKEEYASAIINEMNESSNKNSNVQESSAWSSSALTRPPRTHKRE